MVQQATVAGEGMYAFPNGQWVAKQIAMSSVLTNRHIPLLRRADEFAAQAGVPVLMLMDSAHQYCGQIELDWVSQLRQPETLCLTYAQRHGRGPKDVITRMQAIACACLRNYMDARVLTAQTLIQAHHAGELPEPRVLLVPDFWAVPGQVHSRAVEYRAEVLGGLLMTRQAKGLATAVYVQEHAQHPLAEVLGEAVAEVALGGTLIIA